MLGFSALSQLFNQVLNTTFITEIYHSAQIRENDKGDRIPVAPKDGRYLYVGVDDRKGFYSYTRITGETTFGNNQLLASCNLRLYNVNIPSRMVFFNQDEDRSHDDILAQLIQAFMKSGKEIKIQKLITNSEQLLKEESPGTKFTRTDNTFYMAIDFNIALLLKYDNCPKEIVCNLYPNPVTLKNIDAFTTQFTNEFASEFNN